MVRRSHPGLDVLRLGGHHRAWRDGGMARDLPADQNRVILLRVALDRSRPWPVRRLFAMTRRPRAEGAQCLLKTPEHPMAGVISKLTLIESNVSTGGDGLSALSLSGVAVK